MGCVQAPEPPPELQSVSPPGRGQPVLLGGSPISGKKTHSEVEELEIEHEVEPVDALVTFCAYFKVPPEEHDAWKKNCSVVRAKAKSDCGVTFQHVSFDGTDVVSLRTSFLDGDGMLSHLHGCEQALRAMLKRSRLERLEVHGPQEELHKLRREAASLGDCRFVYFELAEDLPQRASSGAVAGAVTVGQYFRVSRPDLPAFRCHNCAAFAEKAASAAGLQRHIFSFSEGLAHLEEDFTDAEAALTHLQNTASVHASALEKSVLFFVEVHGPAPELARLRSWASADRRGAAPAFQTARGAGPPWLVCPTRPIAEDGSMDSKAAALVVSLMLTQALMFTSNGEPAARARSRSPEKRALSADPPARDQLHLTDAAVTLCIYCSVEPDRLGAWKECVSQSFDLADDEEGILSYGAGLGGAGAHIRAGFRDAPALLAFLQASGAQLRVALGLARVERAELHAPRAGLQQLRRADLALGPLALFELAPDSLRSPRLHSGERGSDVVVSTEHCFRVDEHDLAEFKSTHCANLRARAWGARGLEYYAFSFAPGFAQLRQGFENADAALAHLQSISSALGGAAPAGLELHGPAGEVEKITRWAESAARRTAEPAEGDAAADALARMLSKATIYVLDDESIRRTFDGVPAHAEHPTDLAAAISPYTDEDNDIRASEATPSTEALDERRAPSSAEAAATLATVDEGPSAKDSFGSGSEVERFDLGRGRSILRCGAHLRVHGAACKEEADRLVSEWDRQQRLQAIKTSTCCC